MAAGLNWTCHYDGRAQHIQQGMRGKRWGSPKFLGEKALWFGLP